VRVLVGEPFAVPVGAGRTAVAGATDAIRERLKALVAVLDDTVEGLPAAH
jgi:hypothetical protein